MNNLLTAATEYKCLGLSLIPIGDKKRSLLWWPAYQNKIMSDYILMRVFAYSSSKGIAIVCGYISGNFEAIDFDCKNDLTKRLFVDYLYRLADANPNLVTRLVVASTRNGGFHLYYRCGQMGRNSVLARRPCTAGEKAMNPHQKVKVLIEAKGTGGYIIVPPTDGYEFLQHDFSKLPLIEPDERKTLLSVAKLFDQCGGYSSQSIINSLPFVNTDPESPFNDFNRRANVIDLLEQHGWMIVKQTRIRTYFKRPGDTDHETSGDLNHQLGLFGVFTTSTEFEQYKGYKPHAVYAYLECDGDFKLAAKRLLAAGYGIPYKNRY